jgi:hypothetical protein
MSGFNERFQLCLANGLTTRQALVAKLPVAQMVDRSILADLVLTHYPAH